MPGRPGLPSVTEILEAAGLGPHFHFLPPDKRDYVLARGRALHAAIQYAEEGALDEASLHPAIAGRFRGYRRFRAEQPYRPLLIEPELVHPWGFCGHPDQIGLWANGIGEELTLLDWKSSIDPLYGARQLAGYAMLWRATHPGEPLRRHVLVRLDDDGTYDLKPLDLTPHENVFTAAFVVWRARQESGS